MAFFIVDALWLMLPAYVSNSSAVLFAGAVPVDFGKDFVDGRRIFGSGKTYRGLIGGTAVGTSVGFIQNAIGSLSLSAVPLFVPVYVIITLAFGALLGDLVKSFFKRRLGFERGASFPIVDQYDFVVGSWVLTYLLFTDWFVANFTTPVIVTVLVVTPVLHVSINYLGYRLGKKKEPW